MTTLRTSKKPALQDWHKADVKAAIEKAGQTLRGLSKLHGVSSAYFAEALHRPIPRAQAILAEVIGVQPQAIWPSRYEKDGAPKRGLYEKSHQNGRDYQLRSVRKSPGARKEKANSNLGISR
jgi:Ner family transcriptional regulator